LDTREIPAAEIKKEKKEKSLKAKQGKATHLKKIIKKQGKLLRRLDIDAEDDALDLVRNYSRLLFLDLLQKGSLN
jgi:3-methyladenine DNA glycosylase Mpg